MGIMIIATSLDSCEDELNEVVHEWGLVNSNCSINGSNFSSCRLWKASGVNPASPFVITVPQNITEQVDELTPGFPLGEREGGRARTQVLPPGWCCCSRSVHCTPCRQTASENGVPKSLHQDDGARAENRNVIRTSLLKVTVFAPRPGALKELVNKVFSSEAITTGC